MTEVQTNAAEAVRKQNPLFQGTLEVHEITKTGTTAKGKPYKQARATLVTSKNQKVFERNTMAFTDEAVSLLEPGFKGTVVARLDGGSIVVVCLPREREEAANNNEAATEAAQAA